MQVRRGPGPRVLAGPLPARAEALPLRAGGELHTGDWRAGAPPPAHADPGAGFAPLGAIPEAGATGYRWPLGDRDRLWADDIGELVEQASAQQWDASRDIPWEAARGLPDDVERAVAQVMTFIAQNEYAALYVPAGFLPNVNPQLAELLLWLGSHVHDEARHIEVFTKRALAGGQAGYALASTELSLSTLLEEHDFTASSLLLNVLGEGTFLDLLKFISTTRPTPPAPRPPASPIATSAATCTSASPTSAARSSTTPELRTLLVAAAEGRAAKLVSLSGLSPVFLEALTLMTAASLQPAELGEGAAQVRKLMGRMERNRIRRLRACGFDAATARHISDLHTPNLM